MGNSDKFSAPSLNHAREFQFPMGNSDLGVVNTDGPRMFQFPMGNSDITALKAMSELKFGVNCFNSLWEILTIGGNTSRKNKLFQFPMGNSDEPSADFVSCVALFQFPMGNSDAWKERFSATRTCFNSLWEILTVHRDLLPFEVLATDVSIPYGKF